MVWNLWAKITSKYKNQYLYKELKKKKKKRKKKLTIESISKKTTINGNRLKILGIDNMNNWSSKVKEYMIDMERVLFFAFCF